MNRFKIKRTFAALGTVGASFLFFSVLHSAGIHRNDWQYWALIGLTIIITILNMIGDEQ